ncbi:hypothetical protein EVJ58_g3631 [Rhodofomes roseus]|uniref:non-specific serine/threonine protein kinase n=1 Tax=Rhodofomes roseus TaxID=34475 RepID=A0A4Y9YJT5_9APHY|nr:hypothetical protein EVJ58_g3631 [Rhodofomes roseus]
MAARSIVAFACAPTTFRDALDALKESVRAFFPPKASCHTPPAYTFTAQTRPDASTDMDAENASVPHLSGAVVVASVGLGHTSSSNLGRHQQFLRLLHVAYPSPSTLFPVPVLDNVEMAFDLTIDEDRPRLNATRSTARLSSTSSDTNDAEQPKTVVSVGGNVAPSSPRLSGQSSSSSDSDPPFECLTPALATDVQLHDGKAAVSQAPLLTDVASPTNGTDSTHAPHVALQGQTPFVYDGQDEQESCVEPLIADAADSNGQSGDAVLQAKDEGTADECTLCDADADSGDETIAREPMEPLDEAEDTNSGNTDDEPEEPIVFSSPSTGDQYTVKGVIGAGGFGRVSEVTNHYGQHFAVKVICKRDAYKTVNQWPGMMGLLDSWEDKNNIYFVMMKETELFYCAEMLISVWQLHRVTIVHRDIKPENILLDQHGRCTFADFGLALVSTTGQSIEEVTSSHVVGTEEFLAPEQHLGLEHGYKVDIWQLGCVWIELLANLDRSWNRSCGFEWSYKTFQERGTRGKLRESVIKLLDGHPALDLLLCMTEPDPANRPTTEEIMSHPWFAGINWDTLFEEPGIAQHKRESPGSSVHAFLKLMSPTDFFLPEYSKPGASSPRFSTREAVRTSHMMFQKERSTEEKHARSFMEDQLRMFDVEPRAFSWPNDDA